MLHATIDFETRSECDLKKSGSWRYSLDPTTEILCLVWRLPHWVPGRTALWHPAFPHLGMKERREDLDALAELIEWVWAGGLVEAHNAWFERGVWTNILAPRYGFPTIPHTSYRCSAAKAATHSLPRKLEGATEAMRLPEQKDSEGHDLILKLCKPRKALKKEVRAWAVQNAPCRACKGAGKHKVGRAKATPCPACGGTGANPDVVVPPMPTLWHESREQFERVFAYCRQDVIAEEGLSKVIPELNETETAVYLMDQAINERGFMLDRDAIDVALAMIAEETITLTKELVVLTKGAVERATQRERMKVWFGAHGLALENTQAATFDALLKEIADTGKAQGQRVTYPVRRGLEIVRMLGRSSTAKYVTMKHWICPDDRARGGLLYHGASTGRWSGAGVQPHNFPKGKIKTTSEGEKWDMEAAWAHVEELDTDEITALYGSVMEPLSQALRGAIIPTPGTHLFVADYASIEARVLLWLAQDDRALDIFRQHQDIYLDMASEIYGYPCTKEHKDERALGKVAILGLGYQMGWKKFTESAKTMGGIEISEEMSQQVVAAYRAKFWRVKQLWEDQEAAAIEAVQTGKRVRAGRIEWFVKGVFLYAKLPSGRRLAYPFPKVKQVHTPWGDLKDQLTFKGTNPVTRQWHTQTTYGGMLVENLVQAIARDLMAEALLRCEQSGVYTPVLSVHDEMIAEADPALGDVKEFESLMAACPRWAKGCPVEAEGWSGVRYRK